MINLDKFFSPKNIVVIGVSRNPNKVGHVLYRNLVDGDFPGEIFIVNKEAETVLNKKSYKSVTQIREKIDLGIIAVPAKYVLDVVADCNKKGIKDLVIITSGFSEIGNNELENKLATYLKTNNMRMIGVNGLGIFDARAKIDSIFLPRYRMERPKAGGISFVTQSGAVGSTVLDLATKRGHNFAKFVSYGNGTVIDESDIIEYLVKDKYTNVICLYLEAVKDGSKFIRVMREACKKKPVIVLKGGLTPEGTKATLSHTGSLAGDAEVYLGIFKQVGLIRAENLEQMLNFAAIFEKSIRPKGNRVQVITNGGGFGILSADAIATDKKLKLAELSALTVKTLKLKFPDIVIVNNPMDLVGDATTRRYRIALEYCMADTNIDIILLIVLYQTPMLSTDVVDIITEYNHYNKKPIIVVSTGGEFTEILREALAKNNVVTFTFPEEAVKAISALVQYYVKDKLFRLTK